MLFCWVGRPEVVLEGLHAETGDWHPIHFRYKPGEAGRMPAFVSACRELC